LRLVAATAPVRLFTYRTRTSLPYRCDATFTYRGVRPIDRALSTPGIALTLRAAA
jgi:hypothetical protein